MWDRYDLNPIHCHLTPIRSIERITAALYRDVEAAEKQCKELEKVVALIENNRQRFRHIDNVRICTYIHTYMCVFCEEKVTPADAADRRRPIPAGRVVSPR